MMTENKTYSDYAKSILMGDQEPILKSILRQIFKGIYDEISVKCEISSQNSERINDFLNWPEDKDLNETIHFFTWNFFSHKIINNAYGRTFNFPLKEIHNIINRNIFKNRIDEKRRLLNQFAITKAFKLSIKQIYEISVIAEELSRIRNLAAHGDGLNPSQALILLANLSRLLTMTPDSIADGTQGFRNLEKMINEEFLDSILSNIRPDIEDDKSIQAAEDTDDIISEALINKIDDMSNQLKQLKEININLDNILSLVYSPRSPETPAFELLSSRASSSNQIDDEKEASYQDEQRVIAYNQMIEQEDITNSALNEELSDSMLEEGAENITKSELKQNLLKYRTNLKKEMLKEFPSFKNWHNLLMSPLVDAMINNKIDSLNLLKENDTFLHYYDSNQMFGKLLDHYNVEAKKVAAKELFDVQLERYWPDIESMLNDYFSQN